jgi:GTP-binding protein EngB required for normal cell division
MSLEPYKQRDWLYFHYVQKRMNLKDMVQLLEKNYNIKISHQSIYNWLVKYDLLKYRGKGRKIGANLQGKKKASSMGKRPDRAREERMRAMAKSRKKKI